MAVVDLQEVRFTVRAFVRGILTGVVGAAGDDVGESEEKLLNGMSGSLLGLELIVVVNVRLIEDAIVEQSAGWTYEGLAEGVFGLAGSFTDKEQVAGEVAGDVDEATVRIKIGYRADRTTLAGVPVLKEC